MYIPVVLRAVPVACATRAIAGYGKAGKPEVQEMVKRLLKLPGIPGKDAADALGLAITHAHVGVAMARIAQAAQTTQRSTGMYKGGRIL